MILTEKIRKEAVAVQLARPPIAPVQQLWRPPHGGNVNSADSIVRRYGIAQPTAAPLVPHRAASRAFARSAVA
jgi:hypothetical protein